MSMQAIAPQLVESAEGQSLKLLTSQLARNALSYLEKLDRYDCQELLSYATSHWLLSNDDFRIPAEPPSGLISNVNLTSSNTCVLLMPEHSGVTPPDYRELHEIVRELTYGIYVLNQCPFIHLDANYDESTTCQIPPAYVDTRIGQILITVDYFMKALWHGAYIPKEKRVKLSERWRTNVDVNHQTGKPETKKPLLNEFIVAGMVDITEDPELSEAYNQMPAEHGADPSAVEERRFFMTHVDNMVMELHFFQKHVTFHNNVFVMDADYKVSCCLRLLEENLDHQGYQRLHARLQYQEKMLEDNLKKKAEIVHQLELLKFISYMTPFLAGMKKRMKIPDTSRLLPYVTGDECRTERELPPLIIGSDFKCKNFVPGPMYFNLHGGISIELSTESMTEASVDVMAKSERIVARCTRHLHSMLEPDGTLQENYSPLSYEINKKRYYVIVVEFETYYGCTPHRPLWVRTFHDEMIKMRPKRMPMTDIHLQEQFKKCSGHKKAIKYKNPAFGLKAAAQRGMVAVFLSLCRKLPGSRAGKPDEFGLSLLHYAAIFNRVHTASVLLMNAADCNARRTEVQPTGLQTDDPNGITPLHVSARCGSLAVAECLVAVGAKLLVWDQMGWAPIHLATFFNHQSIVKLFVWKHPPLLELRTENHLRATPLLLASSAGALSSLKCLIQLGADVRAADSDGNNVVTLAALGVHINILEFLIRWDNPRVAVWDILVGMLDKRGDEWRQEKAVQCLDILSHRHKIYWQPILKAGALPALIRVLKENDNLRHLVTSVLVNVSENQEIRFALTSGEAAPILVDLLDCDTSDIQSRCAIILADMAQVRGNQEKLASCGGVEPLVKLLESDLEDVLVNATAALRILCTDHPHNQTLATQCGVTSSLVEFLSVASDDLQAGTAAALCALCTKHRDNQDLFMANNVSKPLVDLIRGSRSITVQVKVAGAVEALVLNNSVNQRVFIDLGAAKALLRLMKNIFTEVREQGANALWALAGENRTQQKYIAAQVTIAHIIQMLLESTEKLLRVGCMMAIALGFEDQENQIKLAHADAIQQLVRLLRTRKKNDSVLLLVIKVIGTLCLGVAYRNNQETQQCIADEGGIRVLVHLLMEPPSEEVQVAVALTLACVILSNRQNQEKLYEETHFKFDILLHLLRSNRDDIRLQAGMATTIFAYNNTPQQLAIREAGGIKFSIFQPFLVSDDEFQQCYSAFQVVILARVIVDMGQVELTAQGISVLVSRLGSSVDRVLVLACSLLSSLCHTRAGIPDAIVAADAIQLLVHHIHSVDVEVRNAAAVTLGYLSFNKTAARLMLSICRNKPQCFDKLVTNLGLDPHICPVFIKSFENARATGLPSQWCSSRRKSGNIPEIRVVKAP